MWNFFFCQYIDYVLFFTFQLDKTAEYVAMSRTFTLCIRYLDLYSTRVLTDII